MRRRPLPPSHMEVSYYTFGQGKIYEKIQRKHNFSICNAKMAAKIESLSFLVSDPPKPPGQYPSHNATDFPCCITTNSTNIIFSTLRLPSLLYINIVFQIFKYELFFVFFSCKKYKHMFSITWNQTFDVKFSTNFLQIRS